MALPAEFNTITIVQDWVDTSGAIGVGSVTFTPSGNPVLHALTSDVGIVPATKVATLDGTGHMSIVLPFTNDPDIFPTFSYSVTENISGNKRSYTLEIPIYLAPGPVNLLDIAPVGVAATGTNLLTKGQADALYASIGTGPGAGIDVTALATYLTTHPQTPADASVTDAKVASSAAISLSKTADDTSFSGRLALTNAERTKLTALAGNLAAKADLVGGVVPTTQIPSGILMSKTSDDASGTGRLAMTNAERTSVGIGLQILVASGGVWPGRPTASASAHFGWLDVTGLLAIPTDFVVGSDVLLQPGLA